jgi:glycosyltransferase involved in cell wall biosynthesis
MRPPKVFFFIPAFSGGGAEKQCIFLVNALAKRTDMEIGLVHFHEGINYTLIDKAVVPVYRLAVKSNYDPRNALIVKRFFDEHGADVVFSWLHACDVFTWAARALGGKFTWIMAERDSWYPPDLRYWIRSLVGRHADLIIANSHKGVNYWTEKGVEQKNCHVVGNILADSWFEPRRAQSNQKTVCYAGRLENQKNVVLLIDAFIALANSNSDIRFTIIGEGSLKQHIEEKISVDKKTVISVFGFQKNIRPLFEQAAVFVNVSHHEGKPNTVIENMALGNRLVLSRIPEHVELVGADYPFLVESGTSPDALADMILRALNAPVSEAELLSFHARLASMRTESVVNTYAQILINARSRCHEED